MRSNHEIVCPRCKGSVALRTTRNGFVQRNVLGPLGIYPWKCGACGADFLWPRRNRKRSGFLDASTGKS